jgi:hypothetical protein
VDPAAVEIATGFVEAFGTSDAVGTLVYLSEDADISGLSGVEGPDELRLPLSLLEAQGPRGSWAHPARARGSSASGTGVRRPVDFLDAGAG